jgi:hypothetical protein
MRILTLTLFVLFALAFASRLSARPVVSSDPSQAPPASTSLSKGGGNDGKDGGTGGDDDDEDYRVVRA